MIALPGSGRSRAPMSGWVLVVALVQASVLVATSTRYGYHRDELYFIVAGGHPAFGYPDQPPLVPLLCWAMNTIAPGSLLVLRAPSALIAASTTIGSALVAREAGGGVRAQLIAAVCTAVSGFALAVAHLISTTTPDMLSTSLLGWLAVRAALRGPDAGLLLAGLVVGIGFEAKPQVGLVAAAMVLTILTFGPRDVLRSRWAIAGATLAVALALPYLIWQQAHGWPQQTVARNIAGDQEGGRIGFIPFQLVMVSIPLTPVWIAGLLAPWRRPALRPLRFLTGTYLLVGAAYLVGNGHAYYLASLYPTLLGVGAIGTAAWMRRVRGGAAWLTAAVVLSAAFSLPIALPLLPARDLQGSAVDALNSAQEETVGWPRFTATVARAWHSIPSAQRAVTAVFTQNYGEAGAIDLMGPPDGLPRAYSGHNGFSEWGVPPARDVQALVIGYGNPVAARPQFEGCRTRAVVDDGIGLENQEQGLPVMLCHVTRPWRELWPSLTHFD